MRIGLTIVAFSIVAFFAFVVVFVLYSLHERRATIEDAGRENRSLARTLEQHAARTFDTVDFLLRIATTLLPPADRSMDAATAQAALQSWISYAPQALTAFMLNADGKPLYASWSPAPDDDFADREYFRFHLTEANRGALFVGQPLLGRHSGVKVIPVSRAVRDADGKLLAVMVATIKLSYFSDFFEFDQYRAQRRDRALPQERPDAGQTADGPGR